MEGLRFGKLLVLKQAPTRITGTTRNRSYRYWYCRCDCGVEREVREQNLKAGKCNSCGCEVGKTASVFHRKHGGAGTTEYKSWWMMLSRCYNKANKKYKYYGGRGITVCDGWRNSFENFLGDMGPKPSKNHTIDRFHNDGNYEPNNCRWATAMQQNSNRRTVVMIALEEEMVCLSEFCRRLNLVYPTTLRRIHTGWTVEEVLRGRR
jgi:hypothetical protein